MEEDVTLADEDSRQVLWGRDDGGIFGAGPYRVEAYWNERLIGTKDLQFTE
jgi:hypothetical protein